MATESFAFRHVAHLTENATCKLWLTKLLIAIDEKIWATFPGVSHMSTSADNFWGGYSILEKGV